ncbi:MAG: HAMP domain-containing histidine kinase [Nitrospira sp.]|nr:HAMP domain-containing histidine kinase [Nitrospira sp.]
MPAADAQRAFEPFFTTKADGKGTGLGLFLSRETVMAHGGELSLTTEMGHGTTVVITLPGLPADSETVTLKKEQETVGHDFGSR